jgi:hypothetical protein
MMDWLSTRRCVPAAAGCGSSSTSSGGTSASGGSSGGGTTASAKAGGAPKKLKLGTETTLKGLDGSMKVKVLRFVDPMANPATERPRAGRRFVGVYMKLTNIGTKRYKDAPLNGSRLVTDLPKAANPTILVSGKCTSKAGTDLKIAAGESWTGCLPFQVKRKAKVKGIQFRLNSGYGPETGEWVR